MCTAQMLSDLAIRFHSNSKKQLVKIESIVPLVNSSLHITWCTSKLIFSFPSSFFVPNYCFSFAIILLIPIMNWDNFFFHHIWHDNSTYVDSHHKCSYSWKLNKIHLLAHYLVLHLCSDWASYVSFFLRIAVVALISIIFFRL